MEGHCSTGQSPQRAVVPMEEEEEEKKVFSCLSPSAVYSLLAVLNDTVLQ